MLEGFTTFMDCCLRTRASNVVRNEVDNNNNNNNNIIYIALYTKVLKRFTMEEETRIIKLTLPKK